MAVGVGTFKWTADDKEIEASWTRDGNVLAAARAALARSSRPGRAGHLFQVGNE